MVSAGVNQTWIQTIPLTESDNLGAGQRLTVEVSLLQGGSLPLTAAATHAKGKLYTGSIDIISHANACCQVTVSILRWQVPHRMLPKVSLVDFKPTS